MLEMVREVVLESYDFDGVGLMKTRICISLLATTVALLASCSSGGTGRAPMNQAPAESLASPMLLALNGQKMASGLPTGVIVSWQRETDPRAQGYYLYRDTQDILSADPQLRTNDGNLISQPDSGDTVTFYDEFFPEVGETYYYRVSVVDIYDEESDLSNQLSITIMEQAVDGFNPTSGFFGDSVTILGSNFGIYHPDTDSVLFPTDSDEMLSATIASWQETEIEVTIPHGAITGRIQVVISDTVAQSDDEFVILSPYLTELLPDHAAVGQIIEIYGSNLGDLPSGDDRVTFPGGVDVLHDDLDVSFWTDALLRVKVPESTANEGQITVTVGGVTTNGVFFSTHPRIDKVEPRLVSPGSFSYIGIYGINFGLQSQGRLWIVDLSPTSPLPPVDVDDQYIDSWNEAIIIARIPQAEYGSLPAIRVERDGLPSNDVAIGILPPLTVTFVRPHPGVTLTEPIDIEVQPVAGMERVEFYLFSSGTPVAVDYSGPPFTFHFDPSQYCNGTYTVLARAWRMQESTDGTVCFDVLSRPGDINGDGFVDEMDVRMLPQFFGVCVGEGGYHLYRDPNQDGKIDERDVSAIGYAYYHPASGS